MFASRVTYLCRHWETARRRRAVPRREHAIKNSPRNHRGYALSTGIFSRQGKKILVSAEIAVVVCRHVAGASPPTEASSNAAADRSSARPLRLPAQGRSRPSLVLRRPVPNPACHCHCLSTSLCFLMWSSVWQEQAKPPFTQAFFSYPQVWITLLVTCAPNRRASAYFH
jgi:hypothetical protein